MYSHAHLVAGFVELDAARAEHARRSILPATPTHARLDAHHKLARLERFGHVVIGADSETEHLIELLALGGKKDNRRVGHTGVLQSTQPTAHLKAIHAGHHDVEHRQVERARDQQL